MDANDNRFFREPQSAPDAIRTSIEFLISARANAYSQQGGKLFGGFAIADDFHALAADIAALSAPVPPAEREGDLELSPAQLSIINDMTHAWLDEPARYRIAFRNDCKLLLSASPPPAGAAEPVADMIRTLRNPGPKAREFSEFLSKVADTLERLALPPVRGDREAIALEAGKAATKRAT